MPASLFDQAALDRQTRQLASRPSAPSGYEAVLLDGGTPSSLDALDTGSTWTPAAMTIAGNAADTLSTVWALHHAGIQEANPALGQNPAVLAGLKAAMTVPQIYAEHKLVESGHPMAAKILGASIMGLGAALAAHNISTVKGNR